MMKKISSHFNEKLPNLNSPKLYVCSGMQLFFNVFTYLKIAMQFSN